MRRLSGIVVAGALLLLPAFSVSGHAQEAAAQPAAPTKTTYNADTVIVMYAVNPGKDADYEQVIAKLKEALGKSTSPEAKQQSQNSLTKDTSSTYIHIISPVVKGADYSIVNIVYAVSTDDEKRAFYDLYKGALKGGLSQVNANDLGASSAAPAGPAGGHKASASYNSEPRVISSHSWLFLCPPAGGRSRTRPAEAGHYA
jgi:hypothetical protein